MGTGFKSWYIIRRVTADWSISHNVPPDLHEKWRESWLYVNLQHSDGPLYTPDQFAATPFKTREKAELACFEIIQGDKDLLHNVQVVLR